MFVGSLLPEVFDVTTTGTKVSVAPGPPGEPLDETSTVVCCVCPPLVDRVGLVVASKG
jgi:hypothetical protein